MEPRKTLTVPQLGQSIVCVWRNILRRNACGKERPTESQSLLNSVQKMPASVSGDRTVIAHHKVLSNSTCFQTENHKASCPEPRLLTECQVDFLHEIPTRNLKTARVSFHVVQTFVFSSHHKFFLVGQAFQISSQAFFSVHLDKSSFCGMRVCISPQHTERHSTAEHRAQHRA